MLDDVSREARLETAVRILNGEMRKIPGLAAYLEAFTDEFSVRELMAEVANKLRDPKTPAEFKRKTLKDHTDLLIQYLKADEANRATDDDFMRATEEQLKSILASEFRIVALPDGTYEQCDSVSIAKAVVDMIKELSYSRQWTEIAKLIYVNLKSPEELIHSEQIEESDGVEQSV